ncbi:DUF6279 family lipoprotein [Vibrio marisflavi]|uniref:Lipoprotein n=1 Tax=Vibrio marisflavi CECT 7928 TaxID=634439 RepID=A0ABM8ZZD8_9VIBR|nr:DUF6279 family lipoprotein [Vibrio marisflavi]CAH0536411.1 hypothetical protein VMF7928_00409 [Vibrio marisflavi CECT 7928]
MKKWIVIIICLVCAGCGTQLAYNNADWLAVRYIEGFVELTGDQQEMVKRRVRVFGQWHRENELGLYISQIDTLTMMTPQSFTENDLERLQSSIRERSRAMMQKAAPDVIVLTQSLSDEQVNEFLESVESKHKKRAKKLEKRSSEESRKIYSERITEATEQWLGAVTDQQKQIISNWSNDIVGTSTEWVKYQTRLRNEMKLLLENRHNQMYFITHFNQLLYFPENYLSKTLKTKREKNFKIANKYIVEIVQSINEAQMKHLRNELNDWRAIIVDLQNG